MNDIIIAAYDYTLPDSGGRISSAVLQKFKVNDFDEGSYEAGKELELRFQIRFMRRIDDFILLCSTDSNPGQIYRISCKSGSLTLCQPNIPDILHQGKKIYEENEAQALFRAVSGFFIFTCIVPQSCGTWPPFSLGRLMIKVLLKFTEIHIDLSVDYRNNNTSDRRVFFKKSLGGIWACLHLFHTIAVLVRTDVVCGCTAFHAVI